MFVTVVNNERNKYTLIIKTFLQLNIVKKLNKERTNKKIITETTHNNYGPRKYFQLCEVIDNYSKLTHTDDLR